ncbi:ComEC/Rec2 family competence protein [Blastopirellula marina]|uniref:ComEC/Rec2 family competence protein n=1 Tax=Blastopirellula marina TaxID=124 RepID=UPI001304A2CE|nr:ComEC/Rec2 family competence protein [Blastopirellula marina]
MSRKERDAILAAWFPFSFVDNWPEIKLDSATSPRTSSHEQTVSRPLVLLAAALTCGVVADAWLDLPLTCWLLALGILLTGWLGTWIARRDAWGSIVLLLAVASLGGGWHHSYWNFYPSTELSLSLTPQKQPIALQGWVTDYPRFLPAPSDPSPYEFQRPNQWKVPFRVTMVRSGTTWETVSGETDIYVSGDKLSVGPGESITVFAQATRPEEVLNPGEFNFANWSRSRRRRILLRCNFPECLQPNGQASQASIWDPIQVWRQLIDGKLTAAIPPSLNGLAETIFLGRRERLDDATDDAFRQTGTVHILALSGLHLGILAFVAYHLLRWIPAPIWFPGLALLLLTIGYVLLVDARPPIVRASILVATFCLATILFRRHAFWNTLALAWIVVVCWNPTEIFQAGTQLSFVAVATLAWLANVQRQFRRVDPLTKLIAETRPWPIKLFHKSGRLIGLTLVASLVVWLITLPLVLIHFHTASPWTIVLSPILGVLMTFALIGIVVLLGAAIAVPFLTPDFSQFLSLPLAGLEGLVTLTQQHAQLTIWTAGPALWWVIGFYVGLGLMAFLIACRGFPRRWAVALAACWLAVGFGQGIVQTQTSQAREDLVCTFVSVGHGTCVLVELPGGQNLLYDCGRLGSPRRATESLSAVLWDKGISHLEAVIISHDDADHFNGLPGILDRFSVGAVYCSELMVKTPGHLAATLLDDIRARNIPLRTLSAGKRLKTHPDVDLLVLHPTRKGVLGRDNANSLVVLVEYQGRRILLPGDLESPGTEVVALEQPIDCDVVMAPHHGSQRSNPELFYAWCHPEWIIVSSGSPNVASHEAGKGSPRWLNTAAAGRIEIRLPGNGGPLAIQSLRPGTSNLRD